VTDLSAWLAAVDPADLLPARRRDEAQRIERPLALDGATWIDDVHGYALVRDARGVAYGVPLVRETVGVDGSEPIRRAQPGDGTAAALVRRATAARRSDPDALAVEVFGGPWGAGDAAESGIDVDQTNELVVVGAGPDRVVVKWDLHPAAGNQAGPVRLAALARVGFEGTPRTRALVGLAAGDVRFHVATIGEFVPEAQDGWDWAVDEVRALAQGLPSRADEAVDAVAVLVARMHVALADGEAGRATGADAEAWAVDAGEIVGDAELDLATRASVLAAVAPLADAAGTPVAPIHGDLHVGQVLRTPEPVRYLVIDFDGSPTDTPAQRLAPAPVARDVASMLASWDHVGRVVLHRTDGLEPLQRERVVAWIERAQRLFLQAYTDELAAADRAELLDQKLVRPYQVLQECREYAYARRYLPHWRYVPDAALPALLDRPEGSLA
jgi:maltokinase